MNKTLGILGIVTLLAIGGLSGCNEQQNQSQLPNENDNSLHGEQSRFIGDWKTEEGNTLTFFSNGSSSYNNGSGGYQILNGQLTMYFYQPMATVSVVYDYSFANNDTTLILIDTRSGTSFKYIKQT